MPRKSGILLHISSLPSRFGIGDLGLEAYKFIDLLKKTKQSLWQILPLNPTDTVYGSSPYHSISAFASNPLLISLQGLYQDGLLKQSDIKSVPKFPENRVDFESVTTYKKKMFGIAYENFKRKKVKDEYEKFCQKNNDWLDDFVTFVACKEHFKGSLWIDWPEKIRDRNVDALRAIKEELSECIEFEKFLQFIFLKQWLALKSYCKEEGIKIIGDMPIYVEHDGVDCWVNPHIFKLDSQGRMLALAGVPPDYFSATGQLWGNPVYNWDVLKESRYDWWIRRLEHNFNLFDLTRIDHFRGLVAYWQVPAGENTAIKGEWIPVPIDDFFDVLNQNFSRLPVIAEDLGIITDDVKEAMARYNLMGMNVLLFAFGGDIFENPYIPENLVENSIIYSGTHDNNTARGWFEHDATEEEKNNLFQYLEREVAKEEIHKVFVEMAMMSISNIAIIPLQDLVGLGQEARMNTPSTNEGNWKWRSTSKDVSSLDIKKLKNLTEASKRV
ncbi:MAG: 4-alpha-glucanotransferase [Candidatus Omnitrophota bacterium]